MHLIRPRREVVCEGLINVLLNSLSCMKTRGI
jgi:hypothetical protein